jgi:hypothetical protein
MVSCFSLLHRLQLFPSGTLFLTAAPSTSFLLPCFQWHQPYWLAPRYWELITAHTIPCINHVLQQLGPFLVFWPSEIGPLCCAETSVMNYQYLLRNNAEGCSPLFTRSMRLSLSAPFYLILLRSVLISSSHLLYLDAIYLSASCPPIKFLQAFVTPLFVPHGHSVSSLTFMDPCIIIKIL